MKPSPAPARTPGDSRRQWLRFVLPLLAISLLLGVVGVPRADDEEALSKLVKLQQQLARHLEGLPLEARVVAGGPSP